MTLDLSDPSLEFVSLLEIELGHRIDVDSWTQEGAPNTNCWYISHPEGEPSKVEEDGSEYTERATLALCHANSESWYWDSVNNRLYVHTFGSDDPGGGSYLILSYFWEKLTNKKEVIFDDYQYLQYLDDTIPDITMETSGFHEGGTRQTFGNISVINADGYFDTRLSDYIYEAKKIVYKIGEKGADYADYITFWIGWTFNISWEDLYIEVGIEDLRKYA